MDQKNDLENTSDEMSNVAAAIGTEAESIEDKFQFNATNGYLSTAAEVNGFITNCNMRAKGSIVSEANVHATPYFVASSAPDTSGGLVSRWTGKPDLSLISRTVDANIAVGQPSITNSAHYVKLYAGTGGIAMCIDNSTVTGNKYNIEFRHASDDKIYFRNRGDANCYLGSASHRWTTVYAKNGVVTTSDARKKYDVTSLQDDEILQKFFDNLRPVSYKSTEGDSHRTHYGFIAQEIEENMGKLGLEYSDFAPVVKTPVDEDGQELNDSDEKQRAKIADYQYGLCYEEFIAINTMMIQKLTEEVNSLKKELDALKKG